MEADVIPLNRGRLFPDPITSTQIEGLITIGKSQYTLYPRFQAWFDMGGVVWPGADPQSIPFNLAGLRGTVDGWEVSSEEVIDGIDAFRITGRGSVEFMFAVGVVREDGPEVELWISRTNLLPLRIEVRFEDPETMLRYIYSDYGAPVNISRPENVLDIGLLNGFMAGSLSPKDLGDIARILPVPVQQCIEEEIGAAVYREVIGGESEANLLVLEAYRLCDDAGMDVRQDMYYLDLSTLSITPDQMYRKVLECVLDSIGEVPDRVRGTGADA